MATMREVQVKNTPALKYRHLEILEFGFNITCGENTHAKVGNEETHILFPQLRNQYIEYERPLEAVVDHIKNDTLDWRVHGVYKKGFKGVLELDLPDVADDRVVPS
jgi:hypothetical protein